MIRVMLVDDHAMVRRAVAMMLSVEPDIELVAECGDGAEALAACRQHRPDVVLMDIEMPVLNGIEATKQIAELAAVIILTTFDRDDYLFDALAAGAAGFLLKNAEPEKLLDSIRTIAAGDALLAPEVTKRVIARAMHARPQPTPIDGLGELSARETEVLQLLAEGLSNVEIAQRLFVSEATVKTHVSACLTKLGVRDRVQAAILALRAGLAQLG
ncbi:MAG: DNA-binding response regulator [Arachnia propionica]|nr:MAG: DNA-binding response regulator [Arachnia propionica]